MEVCLRVAQIEESSQGITAASHCSKGWWILNHLSNSSWTCGQNDFMAGWSLWDWKIKRDFLAPLPFSWLLIFSFQSPHINHAYMSNFFCCLSAAFIFILLCPYCTFALSWSSLWSSGSLVPRSELCSAAGTWNHWRLPPGPQPVTAA